MIKVADETRAISVVAQNRSVFLHRKRVDGACMRGSRGELRCNIHGSDLVGHGYIQAPAAQSEEVTYARLELLRREVEQAIAQGLAGIAGKQAMDERGPAVAHGVSHYSIPVCHGAPSVMGPLCLRKRAGVTPGESGS